MLTGLTVRNFKRLEEVSIELGQNVVFIGPNNSGKSTALQALTLWNIGLNRWNEKRSGRETPEKRMPLVHYIGNHPSKAREHFFGLREAKHDLAGISILDRLDGGLQDARPLEQRMWKKREIENYLTSQTALLAFAEAQATGIMAGPLFEAGERQRLRAAMQESINEITDALRKLRKPDPFSDDIRASEEFLVPVFQTFFQKVGLPNLTQKSDFHTLVRFIPANEVSSDVWEMLDSIVEVARSAHPTPEA